MAIPGRARRRVGMGFWLINVCKSFGLLYDYGMSSGHNLVNFSEAANFQREAGGAHHRPSLDWVAPLAEVNEMMAVPQEALLIGRADHYRFGEMLMPHVLGRLLHFSKIRCAGLVEADLTDVGGHAVRNYGECVLEMRGPRLKLVHFGGDVLGLDLVEGYRAAVEEEEAERFGSLSEIGGRDELLRYARRRTGQISDFAYVLEDEGEFHGAGLAFHAVGLSEPWRLGGEAKDRLLGVLRRAQFVGVRDGNGADFLEREGIPVERMPCALSVLPQVCARQLRECRDRESLEAMRSRFPDGWIAVETSSVREEDAARLTAALRETAEREGLGLVFFEANRCGGVGRSARIRRWVEAFPEWQAAEFPSSNLWEVASLLLHSRLYCGGCLSARTICMSGGVARINVPTGTEEALSYCELWEHDGVPVEFDADEEWGEALAEALAVDPRLLREHANWLHGRYRESFDRFCQASGIEPRLVPDGSATEHGRAKVRLHHLHDEWLREMDRESSDAGGRKELRKAWA